LSIVFIAMMNEWLTHVPRARGPELKFQSDQIWLSIANGAHLLQHLCN